MPKQPKQQPQIPPARLIPGTKDPILSTGPPKDAEDWKVKNARAKELIMSTLEPGSEPWKIAEPLELASDIWKALEARYAPTDPQTVIESAKAHEKAVVGEAPVAVNQAEVKASSAAAAEQEYAIKRRKEAMTRATNEFYDSMPNRDQRFLWALLHGGKEETNAWFYGSTTEN